jgi:hypothetical protein
MRLRKYQVGILGALNGFLFSCVLIFYIKQYGRYLEWRNIEDADTLGESPPLLVTHNPKVIAVSLFLIVIFAGVSLLVYQFSQKLRTKPVIFWIVTGVISILVWNLFLICGNALGELSAGRSISLDRVVTVAKFLEGPTSLVIVLLLNCLFGSAVRAFTQSTSQDS